MLCRMLTYGYVVRQDVILFLESTLSKKWNKNELMLKLDCREARATDPPDFGDVILDRRPSQDGGGLELENTKLGMPFSPVFAIIN